MACTNVSIIQNCASVYTINIRVGRIKTNSQLHFIQAYITACLNSRYYFFMIIGKKCESKAYKTIKLFPRAYPDRQNVSHTPTSCPWLNIIRSRKGEQGRNCHFTLSVNGAVRRGAVGVICSFVSSIGKARTHQLCARPSCDAHRVLQGESSADKKAEAVGWGKSHSQVASVKLFV